MDASLQDFLTPFLLDERPIRGRMVRLNGAVNRILQQHHYPERISALLGEALVMAAILSSSLKSDGIITLQVQSKGALSLLVADATDSGNLRGYAKFADDVDVNLPLSELCTEGYLAITLDMGGGDASQRYQGIVPLSGESITESMQAYFKDSQQLMVKAKLAVREVQGQWQAAGIYIEHMPESAAASDDNDAWREARILLETLKDDELLDEALPAEQLLYRLFHESGVWVYDAKPMQAHCRCSREKIKNALTGMKRESLQELLENDCITVDCQFCGSLEIFSLDELVVAAT